MVFNKVIACGINRDQYALRFHIAPAFGLQVTPDRIDNNVVLSFVVIQYAVLNDVIGTNPSEKFFIENRCTCSGNDMPSCNGRQLDYMDGNCSRGDGNQDLVPFLTGN